MITSSSSFPTGFWVSQAPQVEIANTIRNQSFAERGFCKSLPSRDWEFANIYQFCDAGTFDRGDKITKGRSLIAYC